MWVIARVPVCYTLPREVSLHQLLTVGSSYIDPTPVGRKEEGEVIDLGEIEQKIVEKHLELFLRVGLSDTYIRLGDFFPNPIGKMSRDWLIRQAIVSKTSYPKKMCDEALKRAEELKEEIILAFRSNFRAKLTLVSNGTPPSRSTALMVLGSP